MTERQSRYIDKATLLVTCNQKRPCGFVAVEILRFLSLFLDFFKLIFFSNFEAKCAKNVAKNQSKCVLEFSQLGQIRPRAVG
jgi:hypothetical protein